MICRVLIHNLDPRIVGALNSSEMARSIRQVLNIHLNGEAEIPPGQLVLEESRNMIPEVEGQATCRVELTDVPVGMSDSCDFGNALKHLATLYHGEIAANLQARSKADLIVVINPATPVMVVPMKRLQQTRSFFIIGPVEVKGQLDPSKFGSPLNRQDRGFGTIAPPGAG